MSHSAASQSFSSRKTACFQLMPSVPCAAMQVCSRVVCWPAASWPASSSTPPSMPCGPCAQKCESAPLYTVLHCDIGATACVTWYACVSSACETSKLHACITDAYLGCQLGQQGVLVHTVAPAPVMQPHSFCGRCRCRFVAVPCSLPPPANTHMCVHTPHPHAPVEHPPL